MYTSFIGSFFLSESKANVRLHTSVRNLFNESEILEMGSQKLFVSTPYFRNLPASMRGPRGGGGRASRPTLSVESHAITRSHDHRHYKSLS